MVYHRKQQICVSIIEFCTLKLQQLDFFGHLEQCNELPNTDVLLYSC